MHESHPQFHRHILNSFSLTQPTLAILTPSSLFLTDTTNHIYKFTHKQLSQQSISHHDQSIIDTSLQMNVLESDKILYNGQNMEVEEQCVMRMEVGVPVRKCWAGGSQEGEFLVVGVLGGGVRIWVKENQGGGEDNISLYKVVNVQAIQNMNNIIDFGIQIKEDRLLMLVLQKQSQNSLNLQNYIITHKSLVPQQSLPKKIPLTPSQHTFPTNTRIVNKNRQILSGNKLYSIYQQHVVQLKGPTKQVQYIDFVGNQVIVYIDGICVWMQKRNGKVIMVDGISGGVVGMCVYGKVVLVVCEKPTNIHVCSGRGNILWSIPCPQIQNPLLPTLTQTQLSSSSLSSSSPFLLILDKSHLKTHQLPLSSILTPPPSLSLHSPQQHSLHASTISSLKLRSQILTTLQSYITTANYSSIFRYLHNCNNNILLNDGLLYTYNRLKGCLNDKGECILKEMVENAGCLLLESKYESHIENGLSVVLDIAKMLVQEGRDSKIDAKTWKQSVKAIKQVVESKKIKKFQQQNKNKRIFQLSYQLVHTANSHLFKN